MPSTLPRLLKIQMPRGHPLGPEKNRQNHLPPNSLSEQPGL